MHDDLHPEMEKYNDRFWAIVAALFIISLRWLGPAFGFRTGGVVMVILILTAWWASGWRHKLQVGFKGMLLFLGERVKGLEVEEGWRWAPLPLGIKDADCREIPRKLDHLEVFTSDDVAVEIDGTIVTKVVNLDMYFDADPDKLPQAIDDRWDETVRLEVRKKPREYVLGMQKELREKVKEELKDKTSHWGVEITSAIISAIKPSQKIIEDQELAERENLQRKGQEVEIKFSAEMMKLLMVSKEQGGAGLTRDQAYEQVQLATGRATKNIDRKDWSLDATTAAIVAEILAGRRQS